MSWLEYVRTCIMMGIKRARLYASDWGPILSRSSVSHKKRRRAGSLAQVHLFLNVIGGRAKSPLPLSADRRLVNSRKLELYPAFP